MESKRNHLIIITSCITIFNLSWSSWPFVHGSFQIYNINSLDYYLYNYALKKIDKPMVDTLYNVSLPANLTGIEVSFCRVRSRSLWVNSTDHIPYLSIPPWTLPWPFRRRVDLFYVNLGNWSTSYYSVPNHKFVTPVVGFMAYYLNTTNDTNSRLDLNIMGNNQIIVRFPSILVKSSVMKCVRFDVNGTFEFSGLVESESLSCRVKNQGHFSIVVRNRKKNVIERPRVLAGIIVGGLLGSIMVALICVVGYDKWIERKKREKMELMSELNMALETLRVGRSKMCLPTDIRTHPLEEGRYVS